MADVGREQDLLFGLARDHRLGIGQVPVLERRVDADLVLVRRAESAALRLGDAEAPGVRPVGGPRGNPVRPLGMSVQVLAQLRARHRLAHRRASSRRRGGWSRAKSTMRSPAASAIQASPNVPFLRHDPVEDLRAARDLDDLERQHASRRSAGSRGRRRRSGSGRAGRARASARASLARRRRARRTAHGASCSFRHRNASANPVGEFASMPADAHQAAEDVLREPVPRRAGEAKCSSSSSIFRFTTVSSSGTKTFGRAEITVVLRDLVLEDQVVAERVPGQLGDEPVILVEVRAARA